MKKIIQISAASLLALGILGAGSATALTNEAVVQSPTVTQAVENRAVPATAQSTTWDVTTGAFVMWTSWGPLNVQKAYIIKGGSFVSNGVTAQGTVTLGQFGTDAQNVTMPITVTQQSATSITATLQVTGQPPLTLQLGQGTNGIYAGQALVNGQVAALVDAFTVTSASSTVG